MLIAQQTETSRINDLSLSVDRPCPVILPLECGISREELPRLNKLLMLKCALALNPFPARQGFPVSGDAAREGYKNSLKQ